MKADPWESDLALRLTLQGVRMANQDESNWVLYAAAIAGLHTFVWLLKYLQASEGESMTLKERVDQIPGEDGWWTSGSRDDFEQLAFCLCAAGFSEDEAVDFLEKAYTAVASQYGN